MGEEDIKLSIFYIPAFLEATVSKTSPQATPSFCSLTIFTSLRLLSQLREALL